MVECLLRLRSTTLVVDFYTRQMASRFIAVLGVKHPREVRWSHATNTEALLTEALSAASGVNFIEADVIPCIQDTRLRDRRNTAQVGGTAAVHALGTPVMGHPPMKDGSLTFVDFLRIVRAHNAVVFASTSASPQSSAADATKAASATTTTTTKTAIAGAGAGAARRRLVGIKVDFKHPCVVAACLDAIRKSADVTPLRVPLWLNADVWRGPGGKESQFDALRFVAQCRAACPEGSLSLGWTTSLVQASGYTKAHISEALHDLYHRADAVLKPSKSDGPRGTTSMITFAVRALHASRSKLQMVRLVSSAPRGWKHTLTVWGEAGPAEAAWYQGIDVARYAFVDTKPLGVGSYIVLFTSSSVVGTIVALLFALWLYSMKVTFWKSDDDSAYSLK